MNRKILFALVIVPLLFVSGCGNASVLDQYNTNGIGYIEYTDIDTICDSSELTELGADFLSSAEEQLLLSFVVDSSIEISEELEDYDHLILTNPLWIEQFGNPDNLKPVEYDDLSNRMRYFLSEQMPILTVDGNILPDGVQLYEYNSGKLLAFPVNVTLEAANPIEAENPLIILVDKPAQTLNAGSCLLPLTSSGNILFTDFDGLREAFEASALKNYGSVQRLKKQN